MNKNLIGISGRAHNGKTMLSKYLVEKEGYTLLSVAHALKKICSELLGFTSIDEMNEHKTEEKQYILTDKDILFLSEKSDVPFDFIKEKLSEIDNSLTSVRHALQFIGTDIFRKYNQDWHVQQLEKEIKSNSDKKIVIDDIRFKNEFELMKSLDAFLIRIARPVIDNVTHHKSEEELVWQDFEKVIINDGTESHALSQLNKLLSGQNNNVFDEVFNHYIEIALEGKYTLTGDNYHIKVVDEATDRVVDQFTIKDNVLIIEDLKPKLRYG